MSGLGRVPAIRCGVFQCMHNYDITLTYKRGCAFQLLSCLNWCSHCWGSSHGLSGLGSLPGSVTTSIQIRQLLCSLFIVESTRALLEISPYTATGLLVRRKVMFRLSWQPLTSSEAWLIAGAAGGILLPFCCVTYISHSFLTAMVKHGCPSFLIF